MLAFLLTTKAEEDLATDVMDVGAIGVKLVGGIDRPECLLVIGFSLIDFGKADVGIYQARISPECFAVVFLRIPILL